MRFYNLFIVQILLGHLQLGSSSLRAKDTDEITERDLSNHSEDDTTFDCDKGCSMSTGVPVCGVDGISYQNECLASCQDITIKNYGECPGHELMSDETYDTENKVTKFDLERFKDENFFFVAKRKFIKFTKNKKDNNTGSTRNQDPTLGDPVNNDNVSASDTITFARRITENGNEYIAIFDANDIESIFTTPQDPMDEDTDNRNLNENERGIVEKDERSKVCQESCYPYSAIGEFDSEHEQGGCTGTVISPSSVITAAHCLYKDGKYTDLVYFAPGRYRNTEGKVLNPYKVWRVQYATIFSKWVSTQQLRYDVAIAHFSDVEYRGRNIGDITGYMGINATTNDSFELQFSTITGYPYDKPDGELWTSGECWGSFQAGYEDVITYHSCDSVKGNDGSALLDLQTKMVYGINVAEVPVGPNYPNQAFTNIGVIVHDTNIGLITSVAGIRPEYYFEP